jgi:CDP-glucose 4,6-dehydratase
VVVTPEFWRHRRVVVTGHTGFKGAWLTLWLQALGADVTGIGLPPEQEDAAYAAFAPWPELDSRMVDITHGPALTRAMAAARPEVVFHLAAQAFVRRSYRDPILTMQTNVVGTANVLEAAGAAADAPIVVVATTDKVYADTARAGGCREDDELGGSDPYSASKACVELVARSWRASFPDRARVVTARAGNVIGGGDRGEDRLVPDILQSVDAGRPVLLRNPNATRPWQFVLEPLSGYLHYAEHIHMRGRVDPPTLNFGPADAADAVPVSRVVDTMATIAGAGGWVDMGGEHPPESQQLTLDATRAREQLGWTSRSSLEQALTWTLRWHEAQRRGDDLRRLSLGQIEEFEALQPR